MITLCYYLLATAGYMLAFWCLYLLFFRNKPAHAVSRAWLLATVLVPVLLPAVHIPMPKQLALQAPVFSLPEIVVSNKPVTTTVAQTVSLENILQVAYSVIAAWLLLQTAAGYYKVRKTLLKGAKQSIGGSSVYIQTGIGPGSIGNAIFFPAKDIDPLMLQHELAHVRLKHSSDLLLVQLITALCWPNLLLRVILKELKTVHEFQADAFAGSTDSAHYSLLLLDTTLRTNRFSTIHTFHQPPLKRRIAMLQQTNKRLRKGSIFSAMFLAAIFSTTVVWAQQQTTGKLSAAQPKAEPQTAPNAPESLKQTNDGKAFNYVDKMPKFNGNLNDWLTKHIKYPEKARKAGAEGRSIVQFIVTDKGTVANATVVRSSGNELLDNEALAIVNKMPAWTPGNQDGKPVNVYFTLPLSWQLGDKK